eukprot:gene10543-11681_t
MESLLYNYMNELLFRFITDSYCAVKARGYFRPLQHDNSSVRVSFEVFHCINKL